MRRIPIVFSPWQEHVIPYLNVPTFIACSRRNLVGGILASSANPSFSDPARTSMVLGCRDDDEFRAPCQHTLYPRLRFFFTGPVAKLSPTFLFWGEDTLPSTEHIARRCSKASKSLKQTLKRWKWRHMEWKHYGCEIEIPIDSGMGLSITIDELRVFINKTLSTDSLINQLLIKRGVLSISIDSR